MEYKKFKNTILLRLDPGDEVCSSILKVAKSENIKLAEVNGLGAVNKFTVGRFDVDNKEYEKYPFEGSFEISSLHGNITTMNDEVYLHVHLVAGTTNGTSYSGHLNEAYISVTGEIFIRIIKGRVNRVKNGDLPINIIVF